MDIKFNLISDIYNFIRIAQHHATDVRLQQDGYLVDGKSILGIFALDLMRPVRCLVDDGNYEAFDAFVNKM